MEVWRNSTENQQSGHAPRSGPEVNNGRHNAKDGMPERLRCGTVQEEMSPILQKVFAGAARCKTANSFRFKLLVASWYVSFTKI